MTKIKKVWLGIFLAILVLPEILWSTIGNLLYPFFVPAKGGSYPELRPNFLMNTGNKNLWAYIIGIQFLGILAATVVWFLARKSISSKTLFWIVFVLMALLTLFMFIAFYFQLTFRPNLVW